MSDEIQHLDQHGRLWAKPYADSQPTTPVVVLPAAEITRLRAIADALPQCWRINEAGELAQDCPVLPGMSIFHVTYAAYPGARATLNDPGQFKTYTVSAAAWAINVAPGEIANSPHAAAKAREMRKVIS